MSVIHWHDILQDLLDEHLHELCGKKVQFTSREYEKKMRYDYYCELDPSVLAGGDVYRPLEHLRRYNIIEFKSFHETFSSRSFFDYVGRLFQVLAGAPRRSKDRKPISDRWGEASLTIILARFPRAFFKECAVRKHLVVKHKPWLYQIQMLAELPIYLMVLPGLRHKDLGFPAALLQALEHDPQYQSTMWHLLMRRDQDDFSESMKRIIMKINEEGFMTYLEKIKAEAVAENEQKFQAERQMRLSEEQLRRKAEKAQMAEEQRRLAEERLRLKAEKAQAEAIAELAAKDSIIEQLKAKIDKLAKSGPGDLSYS